MNMHEEIARVAYELYETRGCAVGHDLDDWLEAEEIVLFRHAGQEIEEPEEEEGIESVAPDLSQKTKVTNKGAVEETEEVYVNEEMS